MSIYFFFLTKIRYLLYSRISGTGQTGYPAKSVSSTTLFSYHIKKGYQICNILCSCIPFQEISSCIHLLFSVKIKTFIVKVFTWLYQPDIVNCHVISVVDPDNLHRIWFLKIPDPAWIWPNIEKFLSKLIQDFYIGIEYCHFTIF